MVDQLLPGHSVLPGQSLTTRPAVPGTPASQTQSGVAFRQLLDEQLRSAGGVKFSAHAMRRLESRGIKLDATEVSAIENAVDRAAAKGSRDSLVLAPGYAMVVNVPSRTVVTAFDQQGLQDNVVTSIDSAVFI